MDTVVLDGVEYLKAATAAKQFHYTSDYVGQLCRAKKVDARLVGRTWFVNADSLAEHKNGVQEKDTAPDTKSTQLDDSASNVKIKRIDVNAPLKNKTAKSTTLQNRLKVTSPRLDQAAGSEILYHTDAETLLPTLNEKNVSIDAQQSKTASTTKRFLHIEPASAKKLKIKGEKNTHTSFNSTELPDVALSGKLPVLEYSEAVKQPVKAQSKGKAHPNLVNVLKPAALQKTAVAVESKATSARLVDSTASTTVIPASLWMRTLPLWFTFAAIVLSAVLLSMAAEVSVTGTTATASTSVSIAQFLQLFSP